MAHPINFEPVKPKKEFRAMLKAKTKRPIKAIPTPGQSSAPGNSWLLGGLGIRRRIF